MAKRRPKGRVPGMRKLPNAKLEQRQMIRGAGGALAALRREQEEREKEGRPMSKLEVLEREQEIVQRVQEVYRARMAPITGERVELDEGFSL